jgi:hypothetical protein
VEYIWSFCWVFLWMVYLLVTSVGFRSPTITVLEFICTLRALELFIFLMSMGAPVFGGNMLKIDISYWGIVPFINMKWLSLSLLIDFSLNSTLSDMSIVIPACLWGPFAWKTFFQSLTLSRCLFFLAWWISCKQHMVGSSFLTWFAILCLLIGALRPFTFSVNIERCLLFSVSVIPPLFSFTYSLFTGLLSQKGLFFLEYSFLTLVSHSNLKVL